MVDALVVQPLRGVATLHALNTFKYSNNEDFMRIKEMVVIDNDTREVFVDGIKWQPSPESYMHLARFKSGLYSERPIEGERIHPGIAMYRTVSNMGVSRA